MKRIIIADGYPLLRIGLTQLLKQTFPSVTIKEVTEDEALEAAIGQEEWDLIIYDLELSGSTGLQRLEQIKQVRPTLPVLVLGHFAENLYAARVLKSGASGYLNKKVSLALLSNTVNRILLGKKYIPEDIAEQLISQKEFKKLHETLSNREFEIFKLLAEGKNITQVAANTTLAITTVSTLRTRILKKLSLSSNADLIMYAIVNKIIAD
ncbi:MAG: DNA-binding response regulator [Sphingobacteriales bacterium]|nr:MAG: DNA-binding response regulator [Sphingobacteriales bacterium]